MDQSNSLPILNTQFFKDHPVPIELYRAWQEAFNWSEKIIPVYQWKNLLYIAVSEIPLRLPIIEGMDSKLVLSTPDSIKSVWLNFQQQNQSILQDYQTKNQTSSNMISQDLASPDLELPQNLSFPDLNSSNSNISVTNSQIAESQNTNFPDTNNLLDLNLEEEQPYVSMDTLSLVNQSPEGLDINLLQTKSSKSKISHPLQTKPLTEEKAEAFTDENTDPNIKDLPSEFAESEFVQKIFDQLSYHFTKSMVLLVDDPRTNGLIPWKWDSEFHANTGSTDSYPLEIPSPFRVAFRTQKPYHGYIVSNDINDRFFETWNDNATPDHLTVTPVMVKDEVKAMILSIGEKSADNKNSLNLSGKMANELGLYLGGHPETLKSAIKTLNKSSIKNSTSNSSVA